MGAEPEDLLYTIEAEEDSELIIGADKVAAVKKEAELTLAEVEQILEANTSVIAVETETTVTVEEEVKDLLEPELELTIEAEVEEVVAIKEVEEVVEIKGKPVDFIETVASDSCDATLSEEANTSSVIEITTETTVVSTTVDEEADTPSPEPVVDDQQEADFIDFLSEEPSTSGIEITTETTVVTTTVKKEDDTPSPEPDVDDEEQEVDFMDFL